MVLSFFSLKYFDSIRLKLSIKGHNGLTQLRRLRGEGPLYRSRHLHHMLDNYALSTLNNLSKELMLGIIGQFINLVILD